MPVTFIYGDHDWMDPAGAERAVTALRGAGAEAATPGDLRVFTITDSGHYTFLDQPEDFLRNMMTTCQPYVDGKVRGQCPKPYDVNAACWRCDMLLAGSNDTSLCDTNPSLGCFSVFLPLYGPFEGRLTSTACRCSFKLAQLPWPVAQDWGTDWSVLLSTGSCNAPLPRLCAGRQQDEPRRQPGGPSDQLPSGRLQRVQRL